MSVLNCLRGKAASGLAPKEAADALAEAVEARAAERARIIGKAAAEAEAAGELLESGKAALTREIMLRADSIERQIAITNDVIAYKNTVAELRDGKSAWSFGNKAPLGLRKATSSALLPAIRALVTRDPWEIGTGDNVSYLARNIRGEAHRLLAEHVEAIRPKLLGLKDETAFEHDVLRALYDGAGASVEARALADAWRTQVAPFLMKEHNAVSRGGIAERRDWRIANPAMDRAKVAAVTKEAFIDATLPRLDRAQMLSYDTGKPLDDGALRRLLGQVHDTVAAGGVEGPAAPGGGRAMLANNRMDHRVLAFRSAEDWIDHAGQFGEHASPWQAMTGHIASMAQDVATMRVFGPNPAATRAYILSLFDREATGLLTESPDGTRVIDAVKMNRAALNEVNGDRKSFETLWDHMTGEARQPANPAIAQAMGDFRSWLVASQMGSAIISSISDFGLVGITARMNDVPAMKVMTRYLDGLKNHELEIKAGQAGFVIDSLIQAHHGVDRVLGEEIRSGAVGKVATGVIRASGLRRHSAVMRASFGLEYQAAVARDIGLKWGELSQGRRAGLSRVGIDEAGWDVMRRAEPWHPRDDAPFMTANDIRQLGHPDARSLADRYQRLLDTEMDHAVIEPGDLLTQAFMLGDNRPGTWSGEARRAVGLYKSFPITFMNTAMARVFARGWDGSRMAHAGLTVAAMTIFGAAAMQTKEMANGRDPLSLDPTERKGQLAWGRALLQGGGLGVFGDMLAVDKTKFGNSWAATLAGPQFAAIESVLGQNLLGNITKAMKGQETHLAGDMLYAAGRYMPGSSLWHARLAFQRNVMDQLAIMIDERAPERFRRIESEARKNWGQDFWWRPGERAPERAPDLSRMMEPQP